MGSFPKYDVHYLIVPLCYIIVPLLVISLLYSSWGSIELGGKAMWQLFQLLSMPIIYLKNIVCTCKYKAKVQFRDYVVALVSTCTHLSIRLHDMLN